MIRQYPAIQRPDGEPIDRDCHTTSEHFLRIMAFLSVISGTVVGLGILIQWILHLK